MKRFAFAGVAVGAVAGAAAVALSSTGGDWRGGASPVPARALPAGAPPASVQPSVSPPLSDADADAHQSAVDMWHRKWEEGQIGFHLPKAHHQLVRHKTALLGEGVTSPPEASKRVFIPLCGKAVDMLWLAACGHRVYGVELSGAAAAEFFAASGMPRSVTAADRPRGGSWGTGVKRVHTAGNVAIIEGDLFSLHPSAPPTAGDDERVKHPASAAESTESISFSEEALRFAAGEGPLMDAVWDRGALVAVEPGLRRRYAEVLAERMVPGGKMLVVAVSYDPDAGVKGPPHNVPMDELRALYEPLGMEVRLLGSEECIDTAPPRMREKISSMTESTYLVSKPGLRRRW